MIEKTDDLRIFETAEQIIAYPYAALAQIRRLRTERDTFAWRLNRLDEHLARLDAQLEALIHLASETESK
jgi:hypothetical protein